MPEQPKLLSPAPPPPGSSGAAPSASGSGLPSVVDRIAVALEANLSDGLKNPAQADYEDWAERLAAAPVPAQVEIVTVPDLNPDGSKKAPKPQ